MSEKTFEGAGGLKIFTRTWRAAQPPRAVVVLVHGFNSHSGYYTWAAEQLAASGLAVYALDLQGRGKSEGERFYVERAEDYAINVAKLVAIAKAGEPGSPVFLLGHSAGGVVACLYALEGQAALAGLICESFAYQVPAPDFALAILKGWARIAPHTRVLRLKNADFSRDPAVVRAMDDDPLIANEKQPAQTAAALVRAAERLTKEFALIKLPLLILHGTADKATKPSGSRRFYDSAGSHDKTLKLYEGHAHDLLNDVGRELVMADIQRWIDARITAPLRSARSQEPSHA